MSDRAEPPKTRTSGSETRQRQALLGFRATPTEHAEIAARAERAGLTVSGYLRALAFGKDTPQPRAAKRPPVEKQALVNLSAELGRVGNNINQIARHLNQGKDFEAGAFAHYYAKLDAILDAITAALSGGKKP